MIWCGLIIGFLLGSGSTLIFMWQIIKKVEEENYIDDFEKMAEGK